MAKIEIFEQDLTGIPAEENVTTVYVPGYAITGPVNTPILCRTKDEFQQTFGLTPYEFESLQVYPGTWTENSVPSNDYAYAGDKEKSYLYACDLLDSGLNVLFERIMPESDIAAFTATHNRSTSQEVKSTGVTFITTPSEVSNQGNFTVKAKYPGYLGKQIKFTLTVATSGETPIIKYNYTLTYYLNDSEIPYEVINFNFNPNSEDYIGNKKPKLIDLAFTLPSNEGTPIEDYSLAALNTKQSLTYDTDAGEEFTLTKFYNLLYNLVSNDEKSIFDKLADKTMYSFDFITCGSYPVVGYNGTSGTTNNCIAKRMAKVAGNRGDCIAILDHANINPETTFTTEGKTSLLLLDLAAKAVDVETTLGEKCSKYATMFTPWYITRDLTIEQNITMPASLAYLNCYGNATKVYDNWYAMAGATRGKINNLLQPCFTISGSLADQFQVRDSISVNPIVNIKPYGYCIWGNRTLFSEAGLKDLKASSFLNIRVLSNEVKKAVYKLARKLTFELNTDILWLNFKSELTPILDKMVSGNGLSNYKIIKEATDKRATIKCKIKLYAIEAVEDWDITVELSDSYITVE